jgi:glycosyltransferase involved in cell wall biosynthesis
VSSARRLSIVVACRNEAAYIGVFLDSLAVQDFGGMEWEAIVADGLSEDGTLAILRKYSDTYPQIRVIPNPGRIVSTGLNTAIRIARGDFILRMDAHTEYERGYCRRCVEVLEETGADNAGGPARTKVRGRWDAAIAAAYHSPFSTGGGRFHQESYEGWVDTVPYGCWRRSTMEAIGVFDESLVRNQDDELNLRLVRAGGRIWQSPSIVSWYSPRDSLRGLFRQYFQYGFWKVAVMKKHKIPASWRHLAPGGCLIAGAILLAAAALGSYPSAVLSMLATGLYVSAAILASVAAARSRGWSMLPLLPVVFATYHVSYGAGFLAGLVAWARRENVTAAPLFTRLSR